MSTFPFLSLPVLASNEILKNLSLEDLIFLSTCSKRAYRSVKMANITLNRLKLKFDNGPSILIEYPVQKETNFSFSKWDTDFDPGCSVLIQLNGVNALWNSGAFLSFYSGGFWNQHMMLELVTKYFRDLFKVNKLNVYLRPGIVKDFFLWKITKSINKLEIYSPYDSHLRVSEAEMKLVLDGLDVKILKINALPISDFSYENGLKQEEIHIHNAKWVYLNALLNSEASRIYLSCSNFSASDLNRFLKNWLAGIGLENLYHLHIDENYEFQEEVLEDIQTINWDPRNRPEDFENNKLGAGRDFRRADGTWATVLVDEENFIFHVWK